MSDDQVPPKVFISYSWDSSDHYNWVRDLAVKLTEGGVNVTLDQWSVLLGDQLTEFMETAVRETDYVLIICTPRYKEKSDSRKGGVGYEGHVMTAEIFRHYNHRKFIPIWRAGEWAQAAPSWLAGKLSVDFRKKDEFEDKCNYLLKHLHGLLPGRPPIGPRPAPENPSKNNSPAPSSSGKTTKETVLSSTTLSVTLILIAVVIIAAYYGHLTPFNKRLIDTPPTIASKTSSTPVFTLTASPPPPAKPPVSIRPPISSSGLTSTKFQAVYSNRIGKFIINDINPNTIKFAIRTQSKACNGSIEGSAKWEKGSTTVAEFLDSRKENSADNFDKCHLIFKFGGNEIIVTQDGCLNHFSSGCSFAGRYYH